VIFNTLVDHVSEKIIYYAS